MRRLKAVMALERLCKLAIGDLLVQLIDGHGLRAIDIARATGRRPADLSEMLKTARIFPPTERPDGVLYNSFLLAMRMTARFPELKLSPSEALERIISARMSQHRDATRYFAALARDGAGGRPRLLPGSRSARPGAFDRPHQCRFQDLRGLIPDRSIALLHLDPPYVYRDCAKGSRASHNVACDRSDPELAIEVVVDLLRDWQPTLALNGVVLLWQPWGALLPQIAEAIDAYRWKVWGPIVWDKGRPQPGNFASPYSVQGEMLWMLYRPGDRPMNGDGSSRESILRFDPVNYPTVADRQVHPFEKPEALMRHLLLKHTRSGEVVFDACGCTGVMSSVAIEQGRRWVYAESNIENYGLGTSRIANHLASRRAQAS